VALQNKTVQLLIFVILLSILTKITPSPITVIGECEGTPGSAYNAYLFLCFFYLIIALAGMRFIILSEFRGWKAWLFSILFITVLPILAATAWFLLLMEPGVENFIRTQNFWTSFYKQGCYGDTDIAHNWLNTLITSFLYFACTAFLLNRLKAKLN